MLGMTKATIELNDTAKTVLKCLYNPSDLKITRTVEYAEKKVMGKGFPRMQFTSTTQATLTFKLFFDTYSAGIETGNTKLLVNNTMPTLLKMDVTKFTKPFVELVEINPDAHEPHEITFKWGKNSFKGYITQIIEDYTMFSSDGTALRATLDITMKGSAGKKQIFNSPDRTKHRTVKSGEMLYGFAYAEYGDCAEWRRIAETNGIDNPRLLKSGESIVIPAII